MKKLKVQDHLYAFLVQHRQLSLPGVGTFSLHPEEVSVKDEQGNPQPSIHFDAKRINHFDEELLTFLKEKTGKMRALAQSDLESFLHNGTQLLNIGKPFDIPLIGAIQKSSDGVYSFQQGQLHPEQMHTAQTQKLMQQGSAGAASAQDSDYAVLPSPNKNTSRKKWYLFFIFFAFAIIAWIIFLTLSGNKTTVNPDETVVSAEQSLPPVDPSLNQPSSNDSLTQIRKDSVTGFELLLQSASSVDSLKKQYNKLIERDHPVRIDSSEERARLLITIRKPLKDTTYVIDSLRKWYRMKPRFYDTIMH